jgi:hypothetical protein
LVLKFREEIEVDPIVKRRENEFFPYIYEIQIIKNSIFSKAIYIYIINSMKLYLSS